MKTSRILLVTGLLALGTSFLTAGPGPQFWNRSTASKSAPTVVADTASTTAPMACAAMPSCACCKKA